MQVVLINGKLVNVAVTTTSTWCLQVNDALAARAGNNVLLVAYLGEPLTGGSDEAHQV